MNLLFRHELLTSFFLKREKEKEKSGSRKKIGNSLRFLPLFSPQKYFSPIESKRRNLHLITVIIYLELYIWKSHLPLFRKIQERGSEDEEEADFYRFFWRKVFLHLFGEKKLLHME